MAFALDSSVPVSIGPDGFSLKNLVLQLPNGQLTVQSLIKRGSLLETTGNARGHSTGLFARHVAGLEKYSQKRFDPWLRTGS